MKKKGLQKKSRGPIDIHKYPATCPTCGKGTVTFVQNVSIKKCFDCKKEATKIYRKAQKVRKQLGYTSAT